jgi:hypothetical protein
MTEAEFEEVTLSIIQSLLRMLQVADTCRARGVDRNTIWMRLCEVRRPNRPPHIPSTHTGEPANDHEIFSS